MTWSSARLAWLLVAIWSFNCALANAQLHSWVMAALAGVASIAAIGSWWEER